MLKLERVPKSSSLSLQMREKERIFDLPLLKALGIALLLHTGGWLLFKITPFSSSSSFLFPPVQVASDHFIGQVSTIEADEPSVDDDLPLPPLDLSPTIDWIIDPPLSHLLPDITLSTEAVDALEERLWPIWHGQLSPPPTTPLIKLTSAGDLAHRQWIQASPLLDTLEPLDSLSPHDLFVAYEVLLDERTGELFWYERIESSGVDAIDQLTETIVLSLRYSTKQPDEGPVKGTLHFAIHPSANGI